MCLYTTQRRTHTHRRALGRERKPRARAGQTAREIHLPASVRVSLGSVLSPATRSAHFQEVRSRSFLPSNVFGRALLPSPRPELRPPRARPACLLLGLPGLLRAPTTTNSSLNTAERVTVSPSAPDPWASVFLAQINAKKEKSLTGASASAHQRPPHPAPIRIPRVTTVVPPPLPPRPPTALRTKHKHHAGHACLLGPQPVAPAARPAPLTHCAPRMVAHEQLLRVPRPCALVSARGTLRLSSSPSPVLHVL